MEIINIEDNDEFLEEYIRLCSLEWGTLKSDDEIKSYIIDKRKRIHSEDKVISILDAKDIMVKRLVVSMLEIKLQKKISKLDLKMEH